MTAMLASIASVAEAAILLDSGVDVIDIKEPSRGALGAVAHDTAADIVRLVNGRVKTSATIGDLSVDSDQLLTYIRQTAKTGVDYVKVGLFSDKPPITFIRQIAQGAAEHIKIVIVVFAEYYIGWQQLQPLAAGNISGLMLDTCNKDGQALPALLNPHILAAFIEWGRCAQLMTGLAGSLRLEDIDHLLTLGPDYLGFRGALCNSHCRNQPIDKKKTIQIREKMIKAQVDDNGRYHQCR